MWPKEKAKRRRGGKEGPEGNGCEAVLHKAGGDVRKRLSWRLT